jgi:hypothetical protein
MSTVLQSPSYIIGPSGQPTAVLLEWAAWESILEQLKGREDDEVLRAARADLGILARHERPAGWKSWADFEAELDAREAGGL